MLQEGRKVRTPNEWKFGGTGSILEEYDWNMNRKEKSVSWIRVGFFSHICDIFLV